MPTPTITPLPPAPQRSDLPGVFRTKSDAFVAGLVVFLCVLCWAVFIWELDIRVPVWPQF